MSTENRASGEAAIETLIVPPPVIEDRPLSADLGPYEREPSSLDSPPGAAQRWALWVFVALVVAALPILMWLGSYRWFFGDEWSFLADRSVDVDGVIRPHNLQHWVSLPVLVYRGLYSIIGIRAYWPYQLVVVVLHLTLACLIRVVMRRSGVDPWIATVLAGMFVLLGSAEDNILWAFQITFVGALVAGVTQMILADHDGAIDRRDWLGLGAGLIAISTSGIGPAMVVAVTLVCVLRRRWWAAVFHSVPLAAVFLVWRLVESMQAVLQVEETPFGVRAYVRWMASGVQGLFMGLGHFALLAIVIATIFVVGWIVAWRDERSGLLRRAALPLSMVVAAVICMSAAAPSRFMGGYEGARAGRYIGVMAALTLPAIAIGFDAVVRRWPRMLVPALVVLVLPVPFNVGDFRSSTILTPAYFDNLETYTAGLARLPLAREVPPWVRPNVTLLGQPDMSIGWLLGAEAEGKLPPARELAPVTRSVVQVQLGVARTREPVEGGGDCAPSRDPVAWDPQVGDRFVFGTSVGVALRDPRGGPAAPWVQLEPGVAVATLPDLHLLVGPAFGADRFEICR